MPVEIEGKKILREPAYERLRQIIIDDILGTIDQEGKYGQELRPIIEDTLKDGRFKSLVVKLFDDIMKHTNISPKECKKALSMLMEEDIADDIKRNLDHNLEEQAGKRKRGRGRSLYEEGESRLLWRDVPRRYLGSRVSALRDIISLVVNNTAVQIAFIGGITLLVLSTIMFGSLYEAVLAGLTLTAVGAETTGRKLANVLGALGGILIFFVSLSLVFQYLFLTRSRDKWIRDIAARYLRKQREPARHP